ncbi:MAG: cytochrome P450, partial [Anaerolineae bacterium]|nr:cytochrome P450 [Anaerolineae bacterium]
YYVELVAQRPFYYENALKAWVVSSAEGVTEILSHPACRVRPIDEPVPRGLVGSAAGIIFQHLARMNDGHKHVELKQGITARLAEIEATRLVSLSQKWAQARWQGATRLNEYSFELPVYVMADSLGILSDCLPEVVQWVRQFARCLNSLSTPEQVVIGKIAAENLLGRLEPEHGKIWAANLIGLMFQAYEATAGLIGNTLIAVREFGRPIFEHPHLLPDFIQEVIRYNPSVQNTRRYLSEDVIIGGQAMRAGDTVIVVLAAANRDPQINPNPQQFQIGRPNRQYFTFGLGGHACPGAGVASVITQAAIEQCIRMGVADDIQALGYHAYVNLRIPILQEQGQ